MITVPNVDDFRVGNNNQSEIPCRVSSDLHERRNAGPTVSTRDSVKLKSL